MMLDGANLEEEDQKGARTGIFSTFRHTYETWNEQSSCKQKTRESVICIHKKATCTHACSRGSDNEQTPFRPHQKRSMRHAMLHREKLVHKYSRVGVCGRLAASSSSFLLIVVSIPTCEFGIMPTPFSAPFNRSAPPCLLLVYRLKRIISSWLASFYRLGETLRREEWEG